MDKLTVILDRKEMMGRFEGKSLRIDTPATKPQQVPLGMTGMWSSMEVRLIGAHSTESGHPIHAMVATQYTAQLRGRDPGQDLLSAVLGNVGSLIFFRVGQHDAPHLAPLLQPRFSSLDLVNLPDWQGYAKPQLGRANIQPFSFETEKDTTVYSRFRAKQNREWSRKKYGSFYQDVDEQISKRRDIIFEPVD